jgi:hypothetical protein
MIGACVASTIRGVGMEYARQRYNPRAFSFHWS